MAKGGGIFTKHSLALLTALLGGRNVDSRAKNSAALALLELVKGEGPFAKKGQEGLIAVLKDPNMDSYAKSFASSALREAAKGRGGLKIEELEGLMAVLGDPNVNSFAKSSASEALGVIAKEKEEPEELIDLSKDPNIRSMVFGEQIKNTYFINVIKRRSLLNFIRMNSTMHGKKGKIR